MKKLYLICGLLFLVIAGLSGCANKNNGVPLRSVKYYIKHKKQMKAMIKECNKIPNKTAYKIQATHLGMDCANANSAQSSLEQY
jgi:hypothetical protein